MTYIVIVQRTPLQRDVYGPYRSFKAADGDAKAWGGTVEPVMKPAAHDSSEGKLMTANNQLIAIEIEGQVDVHIVGGASDYATVCGLALDGDQNSGVEVPTTRGTKITCSNCRNIWTACRGVQLRQFA